MLAVGWLWAALVSTDACDKGGDGWGDGGSLWLLRGVVLDSGESEGVPAGARHLGLLLRADEDVLELLP